MLALALGGALGAVGTSFPFATLACNVAGAFAMGRLVEAGALIAGLAGLRRALG